ncbi:PCI domain-containing protein 2-like protein [Chytridium lagenaria]|nr:PCI domain-containing protein 2-like protein [Chytridium lagenaria]
MSSGAVAAARKQLNSFIDTFISRVNDEDGEELAEMMRMPSASSKSSSYSSSPSYQHPVLSDAVILQMDPMHWESCSRRLDSPWCDIVLGHLRVARAVRTSDPVDAFAEQTVMAQQFHQAATTLNKNYLPVLYTIILDLRILANLADNRLGESGQKATCLEECARVMNKAFSICATDRFSPIDKSRKWGAYFVCNLLFQTYFRLKQINLATNLIKSLRSADLPDLEKYPIGHVITFKYYMGVLAFYNEQYHKADEYLTFAIKHCRAVGPSPHIYQRNRRLILNYLIPTRLISGKIPHPELYLRYPALKETYERCRFLCFRNLAKKVWLCKGKPTRIEFSAFLSAVHFAGCTDVDTDEVECMLANLIDKGYMKGYMSREKMTLVVSMNNAFPPISTVSLV